MLGNFSCYFSFYRFYHPIARSCVKENGTLIKLENINSTLLERRSLACFPPSLCVPKIGFYLSLSFSFCLRFHSFATLLTLQHFAFQQHLFTLTYITITNLILLFHKLPTTSLKQIKVQVV